MLKLFYSPNACSLAPHIALNEAGVVFETVRVDFKAQEQQSAAYLAINPKGRVPALMTPRGILTENPAILGWIAQTIPEAGLKPEGDFFDFSEMQVFNMYLASTIHVTFGHLIRPARYADSPSAQAEIRARVPQTLGVQWKLIENRLADGRPWVCGDRFSVADPYLYVFARWLERDGAGGSSRFPLTVAHRARMQARAAVLKTLAAEGLTPV
jgi:glutathione S-transferase